MIVTDSNNYSIHEYRQQLEEAWNIVCQIEYLLKGYEKYKYKCSSFGIHEQMFQIEHKYNEILEHLKQLKVTLSEYENLWYYVDRKLRKREEAIQYKIHNLKKSIK